MVSADEATGKSYAAPKMPKCGHCGHDPARIFGAVTRLGPGKVVLICCEDCRAILGVFPHPPEGPQPIPAALWTPTAIG